MLFFEMLKKLKKKRRKTKRNKTISLAITAWLFISLKLRRYRNLLGYYNSLLDDKNP